MFWTQKSPPSRLEAAQETLQERAHEAAQSLESLKASAVEKLAATRAHLDDATRKATLQAEKEAHEARLLAERERAQILADHEKWKSELAAERAKIAKARHDEEAREKELLLKKTKGRRLIVADEDELDIYPLEEDDFGSQKGGAPILLILGAIVLMAVALFYLISGAQGRRSRAAIKGRLDQVKEGLTDATPKTADSVAERVESLAANADAKLATVAEEVGENTTSLGQKVEAAGEALAAKIENIGEHIADATHHKNDENAPPANTSSVLSTDTQSQGDAPFSNPILSELASDDTAPTERDNAPFLDEVGVSPELPAQTLPPPLVEIDPATVDAPTALETREIDNEIEATVQKIEKSAKKAK